MRRKVCFLYFHLALAAAALLVPACDWDGNFTVLGYTTQPLYDPHIHTVYVPIFQNTTFYRGLEFDLTRAVIREIEAKTPFKVVSCRADADTELTGKIISFTKNMLNKNQLNEVREAETILAVEVYWRDLHTGKILSQPLPQKAQDTVAPVAPSMPGLNGPSMPPVQPRGPVLAALPPGSPPPGSPGGPPAPPVLIQSVGGFIPELGESFTTGVQKNINRLAIQIVSMMEAPW